MRRRGDLDKNHPCISQQGLILYYICVAPDGAPVNLVVTAVDAFTASMSWNPPNQEFINGRILGYVVNITRTTNGREVGLFSTNGTSFTHNSLHPNYAYFCGVAVENVVGRGPFNVRSIQMPESSKQVAEK